MSAPYMPLFVADYLADTAHLSAAEHGAYLLLIMNYWQREKPLPADDRKLARIARMSDAEWADAQPTLAEFFVEQDGEWRHARIDEELSVAQQKSAKAKASARASVEARQATAQRTLNDRSADAELLGEDREGKKDNPESKNSTTNVRSVGKPTRPSADDQFEKFWKAYPHRGDALIRRNRRERSSTGRSSGVSSLPPSSPPPAASPRSSAEQGGPGPTSARRP